MIARDWGELDPRASVLGLGSILGLGVLSGTVAALAGLTFAAGSQSAPDVLYLVLGLGSAVAALGVGFVGRDGMQTLEHAIRGAPDEPEAFNAVSSQLVRRCLPFLAVGWATTLAAIFLVALN